jgi:serine phosphatase RsbU (regulator of sigma subunit)
VEFARLHQATLLSDRRERDLATAREVQLHFLPRSRPVVPGYRFFDYYEAAEDVGGDYFGYIPLADGRLAIALGDVSGKGVPAALLMARLCSEVRYCLAISASLVEAIERLNRELAGATLNDRFVTFLLCVLDPVQNTLEIVNAGHVPPLRRRAGTVTKLGIAEAGPPLGYDPCQSYTAFSTPIEEVDTLILYTDGISEARSPADTIYGTQRICRIVADGPSDVEALAQKILDSVERFVAGRAQSDDVCLLAFGREGKGLEAGG